MHKEFVNNVEKFSQTALESAKRFSEIQLRAFERISEHQIDAANDYVKSGVKQLETLSQAGDFPAALKEQTTYLSEMNEKFVQHAKRTAGVLVDSRGELTDWFQERVKAVTPATAEKV